MLDWTVPDEWEVRDAYVAAAGSDERVIDFRASNLHVVSHSVPVDARMTLDELQPHLHSLPDRPDLVPYRTSYYTPTWGFCVSQRVRDSLRPGEYDVVIDAALAPGQLEWGELVIPGEHRAEVLLTTHICHPSLANDNLSGIAALVEVGRQLMASERRRYTYRLLFLPGTIGSLSFLATSRAPRPDRARPRHHRPRRCVRSDVQAQPARCRRHRPRRRHVARRTSMARVCVTSARTATTSDSSARPGSTCPSGG